MFTGTYERGDRTMIWAEQRGSVECHTHTEQVPAGAWSELRRRRSRDNVLTLSGRRRRQRWRGFVFELFAKSASHALLCAGGRPTFRWSRTSQERTGGRRWNVTFIGGGG
eukprot:6211526-Pleurochrysis_carterae.AAC.1